MNASATSEFTSNENKGLLWSALHGAGKFNGIPETALNKVQVMFEKTLREMDESFHIMNQSVDLNVMNKEAIYTVCKRLEHLLNVNDENARMGGGEVREQENLKKQQQIPQLETIYRAEDIQKERQSAFNMELKKKEEEMSSIIKLKKPDEIKFSDDAYDKPIGDDMERLLAETLASRERELEQLNFSTGKEDKGMAEKWINPNSSSKSNVTAVKRVSFNDNVTLSAATVSSTDGGDKDKVDINTLFNKFKKINSSTNPLPPQQPQQPQQSQQPQQPQQKLNLDDDPNDPNIVIKMSDITFIKNSLVDLSMKINYIYDKLSI